MDKTRFQHPSVRLKRFKELRHNFRHQLHISGFVFRSRAVLSYLSVKELSEKPGEVGAPVTIPGSVLWIRAMVGGLRKSKLSGRRNTDSMQLSDEAAEGRLGSRSTKSMRKKYVLGGQCLYLPQAIGLGTKSGIYEWISLNERYSPSIISLPCSSVANCRALRQQAKF